MEKFSQLHSGESWRLPRSDLTPLSREKKGGTPRDPIPLSSPNGGMHVPAGSHTGLADPVHDVRVGTWDRVLSVLLVVRHPCTGKNKALTGVVEVLRLSPVAGVKLLSCVGLEVFLASRLSRPCLRQVENLLRWPGRVGRSTVALRKHRCRTAGVQPPQHPPTPPIGLWILTTGGRVYGKSNGPPHAQTSW